MQIRHETLMQIYREAQDICNKKELLISDLMRLIEKALEQHERGYSLALEIPHQWTDHSSHTIFLPLDEAEFIPLGHDDEFRSTYKPLEK